MLFLCICFYFCTLDTSSPIITPKVEREEPEKIKKWREEQKTRLEEKGSLFMCLLLRIIFIQNLYLLILRTFTS